MDPRVMELRITQWIPVLEEQARSGLTKDEWCIINRVSRGSFFRWQRRVRSYLLEHGEDIGQLQDSDVNEQTDNEFFVELPRSQAVVPGIAALRSLHDDGWDKTAPISIHYGDFLINIRSGVDENQFSTVLRAIRCLLRGKLRAAETAAYFRRYSLPDCACGHQTAHNHYDERRASVTC